MSTEKNAEEFSENDRYLWDGSGKPDLQLQRVENALARFRYAGATPNFSELIPAKRVRSLVFRMPWLPRLAAAAVILLAVASSTVLVLSKKTARIPHAGWDVVRLAGTPQVGANFVNGTATKAKLEVGQLLETNSASRATLSVADIGEVEVEPDSRLRLLQSNSNRKRIALELGTIHAAIWAPPGEFVVDTPSAIAVDLGCAYTLHVAPDGSGILRTTLGWVGFHLHGRDSFIPAGAMCSTRPAIGPGTPYFEDASEQLRAALAQFDFGSQTPEARSAALEVILSQARTRDALTLWHLLSRTDGEDRARVYARFAALVPPPQGVTRDGILRLNQSMLDLWWNALGLGDIGIWRYWEQSSSPENHSQTQYLLKKEMLLKKPR
jgi:FecR protein